MAKAEVWAAVVSLLRSLRESQLLSKFEFRRKGLSVGRRGEGVVSMMASRFAIWNSVIVGSIGTGWSWGWSPERHCQTSLQFESAT